MQQEVALMWFRRDLRLQDNAALYHALTSGLPVVPIFIFDRHILDKLADKNDKRVAFIHSALHDMQHELLPMGSTLDVRYGFAEDIWMQLLASYKVKHVFANHDYEPYALERDARVAQLLKDQGIGFHTYKDQVIFEKAEVTKDDGLPYTVFTPYSKKWKAALNSRRLEPFPCETVFANWLKQPECPLPSLTQMGFEEA
nr:deoxyribodipyrimidine photo-lyase [Chitinophagaceae bacterium]